MQHGKNRVDKLQPISECDIYFNAEMVARIKQSMLEIEEGKSLNISTSKEISNLLRN